MMVTYYNPLKKIWILLSMGEELFLSRMPTYIDGIRKSLYKDLYMNVHSTFAIAKKLTGQWVNKL